MNDQPLVLDRASPTARALKWTSMAVPGARSRSSASRLRPHDSEPFRLCGAGRSSARTSRPSRYPASVPFTIPSPPKGRGHHVNLPIRWSRAEQNHRISRHHVIAARYSVHVWQVRPWEKLRSQSRRHPGTFTNSSRTSRGWANGARSAKVANGPTGRALPSSSFRGHNRIAGYRWSTTSRVTTADPGREFAFSVMDQGHESTRWRYLFQPCDEGTLATESYEFCWAPRAHVMTNILMRRDRRLRHGMEQTLSRLKTAAEVGATL